jgi:OPA family glycerol-3-phosphate transporter-like MFS transporter
VVVIGFSGMILALLLFVGADKLGMGPIGAVISFGILSFFVNGSHGMIGGAASMDFGGRKGAATAVGMIDGFVYLGTAVQSVSLGYLTTRDWHNWPLFLIPFAIVGFLLLTRIWNAKPKGAGGH